MAQGKAIFRASARGARRKGHQLRWAGRAIQRDLLDEFGFAIRPRALEITRGFAPHDTGLLERGLKARVRSYGGRITIEIISTARDPETGYDYLPVTRFGHRQAIIRPREPGGVIAFIPKGAPAGRPIFRAFVHGYRPLRDWVESAYEAMHDELDRAAESIGRKIDRRLL